MKPFSVIVGIALLALLSPWAGGRSRAADRSYEPRGIGGGGATSGLAFSPYAKLWFVGTDMGTLFRSTDEGRSWQPIRHSEAMFDGNLANAVPVGFSADPRVVFHAKGGKDPRRSRDGGVSWKPIHIPLQKDEVIRYWSPDSANPALELCATTQSLFRSTDKGVSWSRVSGIEGEGVGTLAFRHGPQSWVLHATHSAVFLSKDGGKSFAAWYKPAGAQIRAFAGGTDGRSTTLAFLDGNGREACSWARRASASDKDRENTYADCGFVWVSRGGAEPSPAFSRTPKDGGHFVRMAENDPRTVYVTGGAWLNQYGSKVWVSHDAGESWNLTFQIYDWDKHPYAPWPASKLEWSAPGLDIGWDDNGFDNFAVNPRDARMVGGTGYYFVHVSLDGGATWKAPFTRYADTGPRAKGKRWSSTGLEVTSVLRFKFNPGDPRLGYAALSDMAGLVTEDGGQSFRISRAEYNVNYDYAFDPAHPDRVYAASGADHDWPEDWHGNELVGQGGIYLSENRGHSWKRLTPSAGPLSRQYLSVAYDPKRGILYGGTQGAGVARSTDGGRSWGFLNNGLPDSAQIIPQLEIDPVSGNAYALLSGDAPRFSNADMTGIYFLDVQKGSTRWECLRDSVHRPEGVGASYPLWGYPTAFAVDWTRPARDTLWLVDYENHGQWLATGAWKSTDRGENWERVTQFTHPTAITLDPKSPQRVYLGGGYALGGGWGKGGAIYSMDGGRSWRKNEALPLEANLRGVTIDPNRPDRLFYYFFGGGFLYGPRP